MTIKEVHATIEAFGAATKRAIKAGFDGVELHGANTYLIQQFFSPHSNRRTDKYGGDRQRRLTFINELLDSVFRAVAQHANRPFIVGYRFSPEEFTNPGITLEDTLTLVDTLSGFRLDYLHVSLDDHHRISIAKNFQEQRILTYIHQAIAGKKPLVGVGGVRTREDVADVLRDAELVAIGQQLLVDPDWPHKLATGADQDMVTAEFKDAIKFVPFNAPLYNFLVERYQSTPNI